MSSPLKPKDADVTPLIYNLFPLLAGPFPDWEPHLVRARGMGFNWLYFNPVSYPGFSGSLYAVKDHYGFHPELDGEGGGLTGFKNVLWRMGELGLKPMMDLVINHTAIDCPLVKECPQWYRHDDKGRIVHPGAKDGAKKVTWGDLAEVDNAHAVSRAALWEYWDRLVAHHQGMGVKGFRCDAAYHVPADLWRYLIGRARERDPEAAFFAETLGCEIEDVITLAHAGFRFTFNSSKWWDFKAPWCPTQYEATRHLGATVSFPESHDTPRLAHEAKGDPGVILGHYAFSALFSTGVMMPMGFEFGATRQLNVVKTRPDWLDRPQDFTAAVTEINALKTAHPVFMGEGPMFPWEETPRGVSILEKHSADGSAAALIVIRRSLSGTAPDPPFPGWDTEITPDCLKAHDAPLRVFLRN